MPSAQVDGPEETLSHTYSILGAIEDVRKVELFGHRGETVGPIVFPVGTKVRVTRASPGVKKGEVRTVCGVILRSDHDYILTNKKGTGELSGRFREWELEKAEEAE